METTRTLKSFFIKCVIVLFPMIVVTILAVLSDPFKLYGEHDDYYKNDFIALNREYVCLKLYERNTKNITYDSFIFGNSRSHAFKVKHWEVFLPPKSKGFHFDGFGDGVYGIYNKVRYIDETGGKMNNALIIIDQFALTTTENRPGYLYISPPELSKESPVFFYATFFRQLLNFKFVLAYFDYLFFKTYRDYMVDFFPKVKYEDVSENLSGDLYYGVDRMIEEDKAGYYAARVAAGRFSRAGQPKNKPVTGEEKELLIKIKSLFDKHHTDYRIVISPVYDQIPLCNEQLKIVQNIFGAEAVYDYSGVNKYTESMYNYYENDHYRPEVADDIMKEIYSHPISKK
jgi:hypothetical protein